MNEGRTCEASAVFRLATPAIKTMFNTSIENCVLCNHVAHDARLSMLLVDALGSAAQTSSYRVRVSVPAAIQGRKSDMCLKKLDS
jgi:hypothetical protein